MLGYGCGCGKPQIITPTVTNCDNCIIAPKIIWACDTGPLPGATMEFDIKEETTLKLPAGFTYVFSLFDFDSSGINSAVVSSDGIVNLVFKKVFSDRKKYRLRYRIDQVGGKLSKTGEVYFCMRNQCIGCNNGVCDPLTSSACLTMPHFTVEVECGETKIVNIPNWNPTNVVFQGQPSCVSTLTFNPGTKNLTIEVIPGAGGCTIGQNIPIRVLGSLGTVSTETILNFSIVDKSIGVICAQGLKANKCTGDCEPVPVDLELGNGQIDLQLGV